MVDVRDAATPINILNDLTRTRQMNDIKNRFLNILLIKGLREHETILALLVFAAFWSTFLFSAGTVTSGFHLIDDHMVFLINRQLARDNVFQVAANRVTHQLYDTSRFLPVYSVFRVFSIRIFGANFVLLSLLPLITAVLTSWFLYIFARQIRFGIVAAFLFVLLTFIGGQTEIWWLPADAEPIGMLWLSISLYFMAKTIFDAGKLGRTYNVLSVLALITATLSKEPFMLLVPAVVLWNVILYRQHHQLSLIEAIKANLGKIVLLTTVCLGELAFILLKIDTTLIGYAGVDANSLTLYKIASAMKQLVLASNPLLVVIIGAVFLVVLTSKIVYDYVLTPNQWFKSLRSLLEELFCVAVLVGAFVAPQVVLYAKSGFEARYLIPGVMGFAFLNIYLLAKSEQLVSLKAVKLGINVILVIATLLTLAANFRAAYKWAKAFAADGAAVNRALATLASNTNSNDAILIVADPALDYEASHSVHRYLTIQASKTNIYIHPIWRLNRNDYSPFLTELANSHRRQLGNLYIDRLQDKPQIKAIFTWGGADKAFNQLPPTWFNTQGYTRLDFGNYRLYLAS
jgi:hypothetical protein